MDFGGASTSTAAATKHAAPPRTGLAYAPHAPAPLLLGRGVAEAAVRNDQAACGAKAEKPLRVVEDGATEDRTKREQAHSISRMLVAVKCWLEVYAKAAILTFPAAFLAALFAKWWHGHGTALLNSTWYDPQEHVPTFTFWPDAAWSTEWAHDTFLYLEFVTSLVAGASNAASFIATTLNFGCKLVPCLIYSVMVHRTLIFGTWIVAGVWPARPVLFVFNYISPIGVALVGVPLMLAYNVPWTHRCRTLAWLLCCSAVLCLVITCILLLPTIDMRNEYMRICMNVLFPHLGGVVAMGMIYRMYSVVPSGGTLVIIMVASTHVVASGYGQFVQFGVTTLTGAVFQQGLQFVLELSQHRQMFQGQLPERRLRSLFCCLLACASASVTAWRTGRKADTSFAMTGVWPAPQEDAKDERGDVSAETSSEATETSGHDTNTPAAAASGGDHRRASAFESLRSSIQRVSAILVEGGCPEDVLSQVVILVNIFEPVNIIATALLYLLLPLRVNGQRLSSTQVISTCVIKLFGEMLVDITCAYQFNRGSEGGGYIAQLRRIDATTLGATFMLGAGTSCFLTPRWILMSWCVYPHADDPGIVEAFGLCGV
eukprot:TRINITY_DN29910_c0_g1_i3.p1 TRINITY_DN29910_c0_g1~~TRINITY_DN29910_c0_g1_i3.p1  ORF type:complete len:600 (+),score=59.24 TRINITY_DN29910_c0_g1_i3:80-1879(+)